jgi:predicted nucleic acid-binding protein
MRTVIVDTDVAIDYLRGHDYAKALMVGLWEVDAAFLSILSVYELFAGMRADEAEDTQHFIDACNIEPVTVEIASVAGDIYRCQRKEGVTLAPIDCLISATASTRGHKIATHNTSHYPDKKILLRL